MELSDPSIMSSSLRVAPESQSESIHTTTNVVVPSGQEADLQQFIKFLRNKNDSSKTNGDPSSASDEFHENHTETIESIVDYKPDTSTGSKIYVYSINELLNIKKTIPKEYTEEKAESLPRKKFWRLYQKFPDNGNNKSNYRNNQNNNPNNSSNNNNNKSRTYSNDVNSNERRNNNRNKNGRNINNHANGPGNKKNSNKSMALTSDELEFDANFESSGNAIADFEAWKSQMKEMERQKKFGGANSTTSSSSSTAPNMTGNSNKNDSSSTGSSKPTIAQSSIISDFLNLSKNDNNNTSSQMNTGNIIANEDTNATNLSSQYKALEVTTSEQGQKTTGSEDNKTEMPQADRSDNKLPTDLSRSSSSRFTSFFSNASSSSSSKPLETQLKNSNTNEQQDMHDTEQIKTSQQPAIQQQNKPASSSRLMGFFNKPSAPDQNVSPQGQQGNLQTSNRLLPSQQPQQQQHSQPQMAMNLQMKQPLQPMGMQPGNNVFFQNLLNKNKKAEENNQIQQNNGNPKNGQFNQMQIPPPGMVGPPMGHPVQVLPPGLNNFNNKDKKSKNDNAQNLPMQMPPHMGMPPSHMMQGNFNMPPPPGFAGFTPQGPNFQMPISDNGKGRKNSNKDDSHKSKGNTGQLPPQQFMQMMGPPPPGFLPMQGMPPNMPYPPNGMMLPSYPPQPKQNGKDNKDIQMNHQQGFFPQQMPQNLNFPMNPNMPRPSNQQRSGPVLNQNKK
ncbi:similar to Saccharomyces cerevisiae YKL204W EAP1 eIF4E-associated protein, competes with eIF4G for binding to eIF4E [Maudiozyma barnettii]|uniref:Similar to Saccharomyces cerevisiae YKL204W EAP1 eIF4E-associated protein, competes with eIF4G for binding to eIF4E n=1 Tax=Maudiozyma barnettii TaxID=61262 RepID=A0A8H2VG65_9SACH|nr:Eap1p [Kazachstania barnettii]CAB4254638.1 similar to Saccharomyces cerevisiae YKL204W EAP1 eIF4E-associated protein, competes with eIF4G for binding to eIF4E [Kazachstania barnettii]CAD1782680.1 similar to Saccharomyces cerevisiae YKL204W EAP1 eIF4E-associated protein, competes with eIF4G for binding to eIF4E [Kazachstania barnettii]